MAALDARRPVERRASRRLRAVRDCWRVAPGWRLPFEQGAQVPEVVLQPSSSRAPVAIESDTVRLGRWLPPSRHRRWRRRSSGFASSFGPGIGPRSCSVEQAEGCARPRLMPAGHQRRSAASLRGQAPAKVAASPQQSAQIHCRRLDHLLPRSAASTFNSWPCCNFRRILAREQGSKSSAEDRLERLVEVLRPPPAPCVEFLLGRALSFQSHLLRSADSPAMPARASV